MGYKIVSCNWDIYIVGKIKEDRVKGQELRTDKELNTYTIKNQYQRLKL